MDLLLTTHDTGYERPDGPTIAKVLATLGTSDATYLQASGSGQTGFGLYLQEGSLDRRFRTRDRALPLAWVTEAFQRYAADDLSWRDAVAWEQEHIHVPRESWMTSWPAYIALLVAASAAPWLLHTCPAGPYPPAY